jgi:rare lipoprotein A (peptidoglycan hydrolase)
MRGGAGLRVAALAGVALVALAIALALSDRSDHTSTLPAPAGDWSTALAAAYHPTAKKDACGVLVTGDTMGVSHPVLPCGVKVYLQFQGKQVLTQVIDRGDVAAGRAFSLSPALAKLLGVDGVQPVEWRLAR